MTQTYYTYLCFLPSNNVDYRNHMADSLVSFDNHFASYKPHADHPKSPFSQYGLQFESNWTLQQVLCPIWLCLLAFYMKLHLRETYFKVEYYLRPIYFYLLKEGVILRVLTWWHRWYNTLSIPRCSMQNHMTTDYTTNHLFIPVYFKNNQINQYPLLKAT